MNEVSPPSLINKAKLFNEDILSIMGHHSRDPLLKERSYFGWIQHGAIIAFNFEVFTVDLKGARREDVDPLPSREL
jgi:hypothetical protein